MKKKVDMEHIWTELLIHMVQSIKTPQDMANWPTLKWLSVKDSFGLVGVVKTLRPDRLRNWTISASNFMALLLQLKLNHM